MANTRIRARGAALLVARAIALTTYSQVAAIVGVKGPERSRTMIDATELDQIPSVLPGGDVAEQYYFKQQVPGLKDCSPITLDCNCDQAEFTRMTTIFDTDELCNWKIVLINGLTLQWYGCVGSIGMDSQIDALVKVPITLPPEGRITYTAGT